MPKNSIIAEDQEADDPYCEQNIPVGELPFEVDTDKWGEVKSADLIYSGIYMLRGPKNVLAVKREEAKKIFSSEVLAYGVEEDGAIFFAPSSGRWDDAFRYELLRHAAHNGRSFLAYGSILEIALNGSVSYPDYFGKAVPPTRTPYGQMTRYIEFETGIYFLETEYCVQMLAVSEPIWDCQLTWEATELGEMTDEEKSKEPHLRVGYMFWRKPVCAVPLYELLRTSLHPKLKPFIASKTA